MSKKALFPNKVVRPKKTRHLYYFLKTGIFTDIKAWIKLFICLVQQKPYIGKMENQDNLDLVPYAVPLVTAQDWVTNWIDSDPDNQSTSTPPTSMRAFLVRRAEVVELLNQLDTEFIRMYIGKKPVEEAQTGKKRIRPCLLLVSAAYRKDIDPTSDKDPNTVIDLIGHMNVDDAESTLHAEQNYNVFDFTHVCPPQCDEDSPLFIASDQPCDC